MRLVKINESTFIGFLSTEINTLSNVAGYRAALYFFCKSRDNLSQRAKKSHQVKTVCDFIGKI